MMLFIRPSKGMECNLLSQNVLELSVVTNMLDNSKLHVCVSNVFVDVISSMQLTSLILLSGKEEEEPKCSASCYTYDSCSNCTENKCLWCESLQQCIDTNSYLTHFLYGQCLEWTTQESKCDGLCYCSFIANENEMMVANT